MRIVQLSRRQVVQGAAALGVGSALSSCARRIDPSRVVAVAAPVDGLIQIPLPDLAELQKEGGSVVLLPAGATLGRYGAYPFAALVATAQEGPPRRFIAFNADCPHQGCSLTWVQGDKQVECPCHGSRFASDGRVLNPPAQQELSVLPVEVDAQGMLNVQLLPGDGTFPAAAGGAVTLQIADYPSLQQEGGSVQGRAAGYPYPFIVQKLGGAFRAMSAACPHQGCTVEPASDGFHCPCHGSTFTQSGSLVLGPALSGLDRLAVDQTVPGVLKVSLPS